MLAHGHGKLFLGLLATLIIVDRRRIIDCAVDSTFQSRAAPFLQTSRRISSMLSQLPLLSPSRNDTRRIYASACCIGEDEVCLRVGLGARRFQSMCLPVAVQVFEVHVKPRYLLRYDQHESGP